MLVITVKIPSRERIRHLVVCLFRVATFARFLQALDIEIRRIDATCDPGEDQCNCPADCGTPPSTETTCDDGIDEDCDNDTDCDDVDCDGDPACPDCGAKIAGRWS